LYDQSPQTSPILNMSFRSIIAVTASLAVANAHMIMQSPVPFSVDTVDSGPLNDQQWPCKHNLGYTVSKINTMAVGQKQTLEFKGSAVHGGGSCQLSVTTDTEPTAKSVFKVIQSMEGACPGVDQAEKFDFELPASIPNGKATFAWTWFAKLSGGPEMYMNCAPIEVTGGASDKTAFDALPDMLVANLPNTPGVTCKSPTSKVLKFPNPGENLVTGGNAADIQAGTGDCGSSSGGTTPSEPSSPAGQSPSAPKSSAVAQPTPPAGGSPAGGQSSAAAPSAAPSAPPSNPGGVFAPGASGAPVQSTSTTLVTVTGAPTPAKPTPAKPTPAKPTPAQPTVPASPGTGVPAQPSPPSTGGGSATACSTNGAIVCNGEKQFGLCNNGNVVWQDVAAGTACVNGVVSKRSLNGRVARPRWGARAAKAAGF
jgi:hypothetical protein